MEPILKIVTGALLFLGIIAIFAIIANEPLSMNISSAGLDYAQKIFSFPITCCTGALATATIQVALAALTQSARQSAAATWQLTLSNFLVYIADNRTLPLSALAEAPFSETFTSSTDVTELFRVTYQTPVTTLRRIYGKNELSTDLEPGPSPELQIQLQRIEKHFGALQSRIRTGDNSWLLEFVDFGVSVRQLRLYLAVTTEKMKTWSFASILEMNDFGRKRYSPPYSSHYIATISTDIRLELFCIIDVLHFSSRMEPAVQRLVKCAVGIGRMWSTATPHLQQLLTDVHLDVLWNHPNQLNRGTAEI